MIMSDGRANPNLYSNNRFYDKYTNDSYGYFAQNTNGTTQTRMVDEICTNKNEPQLSPDAVAVTEPQQESFGSTHKLIRDYTTEPARKIVAPKIFCDPSRQTESEDTSFMSKVRDYLTGAGKSESEKTTIEHFCTEHWETVSSGIIIVIVILFLALSVIAIMIIFGGCFGEPSNCAACGKYCSDICPMCNCCSRCCKCDKNESQGLSGGYNVRFNERRLTGSVF